MFLDNNKVIARHQKISVELQPLEANRDTPFLRFFSGRNPRIKLYDSDGCLIPFLVNTLEKFEAENQLVTKPDLIERFIMFFHGGCILGSSEKFADYNHAFPFPIVTGRVKENFVLFKLKKGDDYKVAIFRHRDYNQSAIDGGTEVGRSYRHIVFNGEAARSLVTQFKQFSQNQF